MIGDLARRGLLRSLPLALAPAAKRFSLALRQPRREQAWLRARLARQLARTAYGRSLRVRAPRDWSRVPVVTYDDLRPWLDRQRAEEGAIVTPEPVLFYEKTSGSSGAAKFIPYTATKQRGLRDLFAAWAYDVLRHGTKLRTGRIYLSGSPRLGLAETTVTGRPVGVDHDASYLGGGLQALIGAFAAGPPPQARYADGDAFVEAVATSLLETPDLEIVSVWNPTFFEVILDRIAAIGGDEPDWARVWPALKVVSCWDAGAAAPMAERLRQRLPHAWVQGKGLLATEAVVTVPWVRANACLPLLHHTLIELLTDTGDLVGVMDAEPGETYEIVVSAAGGLARYRLGDRVRVTHRYGTVPGLQFVGRAGAVSDLVGEKLHESFVQDALTAVLPGHRGLTTLLPVAGRPAHYVLVSDRPLPEGTADRLDVALREAHHYGLARALGQLGPLQSAVAPEAGRWLVDREVRRGLVLGDIKPRALQVHPADGTLRTQLGVGHASG